MASKGKKETDMVLPLHASGSWGCGAYTYTRRQWFQLKFPESWHGTHITAKEFLLIILAVAVWGQHWNGVTELCRYNNVVLVAIVTLSRNKMDRAMHLMRCLSCHSSWLGIISVSSHSMENISQLTLSSLN